MLTQHPAAMAASNQAVSKASMALELVSHLRDAERFVEQRRRDLVAVDRRILQLRRSTLIASG